MRIFCDLGQSAPESDLAAEIARVRSNLAQTRAVVAIASAKGGVGKSSVATNLAAALALKGRKVAIVDADLNSPSIVAMLGIKATRLLNGGRGLEPAAGLLGLRVSSSALLGDGEPPAITFVDGEPAPMPPDGARPKTIDYSRTLRQLLGETNLGALDALVIDLAPGLDHLHRLSQILKPSGIVLVSLSSELATQAVREMLRFAAAVETPIWAIVENMVGFNCDSCHSVRPMLPRGALSSMARDYGLELATTLPFDPRLAEACDRGVPFVREMPESPLAKQLLDLADRVDTALAAAPNRDRVQP